MSLNPYLARQLSGYVPQDTINAIQDEYSYADPLVDYLEGLSIDTALTDELDQLGRIIGLVWPTVPDGYLDDTAFALGDAAAFPEYDVLSGFSDSADASIGGFLTDAFANESNRIPIEMYRQALIVFAKIKRNGLTVSSIDGLCSTFSNAYNIQIPPVYFTLGDSSMFPEYDTFSGFGDSSNASVGGPLISSDPELFPDSDIYIVFTSAIGIGYLYVLQEIFAKLCTSPQVFVSIG